MPSVIHVIQSVPAPSVSERGLMEDARGRREHRHNTEDIGDVDTTPFISS